MAKESAESQRLKVVLLTTSFPIVESSSSGIFVKRLADHLAEKAEVEVVCPDDSTTKLSSPKIKRCRYAPKRWQKLAHGEGGIPVALRSNSLLYLLVPPLLLSLFIQTLLLAKSCNILLANWSISALVGFIPSKLYKKKLITVLRGEDTKIENNSLKRLLLMLAIKVSDEVILVSHDMELFLKEEFPNQKGKFQVITNGVDLSLLEEPIAAQLPMISSMPPKLLSVGSLIPRKGVDKIIDALSRLKSFNEDTSLTIVGGGPSEKDLKLLSSQHGLEEKILFVGNLSPLEVYPYYQNHPIFILASSFEGRPNVLIEAMAAGCCVIASRIKGTKEIIKHGDNGLLFSPENIDELSMLLRRCIESKDYRLSLGQKARETIIESKQTWNDTADQYLMLFGKMQ